jgi:two-component system OmpR family response regulator
MKNADQVITRDQIGLAIWEMVFEPDSNVIEVYVARIRSKIDNASALPLIHFLPGSGFWFGSRPPPQNDLSPPTIANDA